MEGKKGANSKYTEALELEIYEAIAETNCTQKELCNRIGVSETHFIEWRKEESPVYKPKLAKLIADARIEFKDRKRPLVISSLYSKAIGSTITDVRTETVQFANGKEATKTYTTVKEVSPDVKAIELILFNEKNAEYGNKQTIEATVIETSTDMATIIKMRADMGLDDKKTV